MVKVGGVVFVDDEAGHGEQRAVICSGLSHDPMSHAPYAVGTALSGWIVIFNPMP